MPAPSPAPAQLPPMHPPTAIPSATPHHPTNASLGLAVKTECPPVITNLPPNNTPGVGLTPTPPHLPPIMTPVSASVVPVQPPAAAPMAGLPLGPHDPSSAGPGQGLRTESPAVATSGTTAVPAPPSSAHQYHHAASVPPVYHQQGTRTHIPAQPLYAPYSSVQHPPLQHQPYASSVPMVVPPVSAGGVGPLPIISSPAIVSTTPSIPGIRESVGVATGVRPSPLPSPRGTHSPGGRERDSYSNVNSLSRSSIPNSTAPTPPTSNLVHSNKPPQSTVAATTWSSTTPGGGTSLVPSVAPLNSQPLSQTQASVTHSPSTATIARPGFPSQPSSGNGAQGGQGGMFGDRGVQVPPVSGAGAGTTPVAPSAASSHPFSAENLFQTNQTDMLRRELDNRFLASQDGRNIGVGGAPPPNSYLRTEMHQHQHHHTHVHQHTTSLLPPPSGGTLFQSPLNVTPMERLGRRPGSSFKDIPKIGSVDSPFYRQNIGMPNYPGYTPGLMHPGLTAGPTPFVPPNHLSTFQPKSITNDPNKPKTMKSGKWNAMHVRVAWEIYHHQQKSGEAKGAPPKPDLLRPPSHLFSPGVHSTPGNRGHELPFPHSLGGPHRTPGFDQPHPSSLFSAPPSHLGTTMSPFSRYTTAPPHYTQPYGFPTSRDMPLGIHDPWRGLQRGYPPSVNPLPPTLPGLQPGAPWGLKPPPDLLSEQREREAREREERERLRREREERERREREEKQRRIEQQQREERERREKERREHERRELERERERERERLLHQQQRLAAESAKQMAPPSVLRDRSPMRNGQADPNDLVRVKEEPRIKEEDVLVRASAAPDPRYHHPYLRHPPMQPAPPSMLDRGRLMQHMPHYVPPPHWPPPHQAADPFYRYVQGYDPLRYNPLVDALRAEEERAKLYNAYSAAAAAHSAHSAHMRPKDPSLLHLRPGPGPGPPQHKHTPPSVVDIHKKEEPR